MLRCAASLVVATYTKVRLTPRDLRALPLELFARSLFVKVIEKIGMKINKQ
jgi:hypothetical protein